MIAGLVAGLGVVGAAYGVSAVATHSAAAKETPEIEAPKTAQAAHPSSGTQVASSQLIASGHALYSSLACVGCHGADAQGNIGPSLHKLGDPDAEVARNIANGYPGQMPAYKEQLTPAQIQTLVAYTQSLE